MILSSTFIIKTHIINRSQISIIKMNSSTSLKLRQNVEQQTKRLLDQLQQLDTLRQQLSQQQYTQLRQSTLQQLQIFQQSLQQMSKDPNNRLLESDLQKTKRMIYQAIKEKFNKEEIKGKILEEQVKGIRKEIVQIDQQHHLKKITTKEYMKKRRNLVVRLQEAGVELTKEQSQWLKTNQNFSNNEQNQNYAQTEQKQMKIVQNQLKKDF